MQHNLFIAFISFTGSFLVAFSLYFPFRKIAKDSGFNAVPNARSSHRNHIPNIGGLMFYLSVPVTLSLLWNQFRFRNIALLSILAVLSFLVIGMIDDRGSRSPRQKLLFQATGTGLFIAGEQLLMKNFFGMANLFFPLSILFTFLFILVVINAMNLIDGIDGLAASTGLIAFGFLGITFYRYELVYYAVFSLSMAGILLAFLFFNYSRKRKMIMGDTGSLWLGFSLSVMLIRAVQIPAMAGPPAGGLQLSSYAVLALVLVPVFDAFRVFFLRLIMRRSPFRADRNHIHHLLIDKAGLNHWQATLCIVGLNVVLFGIVFLAGSFLPAGLMMGIFVLLFIFYNVLLYYVSEQRIPLPKRFNAGTKRRRPEARSS